MCVPTLNANSDYYLLLTRTFVTMSVSQQMEAGVMGCAPTLWFGEERYGAVCVKSVRHYKSEGRGGGAPVRRSE
jgi:hypothetical protein